MISVLCLFAWFLLRLNHRVLFSEDNIFAIWIFVYNSVEDSKTDTASDGVKKEESEVKKEEGTSADPGGGGGGEVKTEPSIESKDTDEDKKPDSKDETSSNTGYVNLSR